MVTGGSFADFGDRFAGDDFVLAMRAYIGSSTRLCQLQKSPGLIAPPRQLRSATVVTRAMIMGGRHIRDAVAWTGVQFLRFVPGSRALRIRRDLRDSAWLRHADVVIISFPKSGRTFVRAMLSRLYQRRFDIDERKLLEFEMLRKARPEVPRLLFTHAGDAMRRPEQIKVHPGRYANARVILLARHPGDIAVSRHHHLRHRSRGHARRRLAEQPLELFVWDEHGGIPSIVRFLNLWAELSRQRADVTIVRYEDFLTDPQGTLKSLAKQVGLRVTKADVDDAVNFAHFGNLQEREREGYFVSARLQPSKAGDSRSSKVRVGGSGGYRKRLEAREAKKIDRYIAEHLDPCFGY